MIHLRDTFLSSIFQPCYFHALTLTHAFTLTCPLRPQPVLKWLPHYTKQQFIGDLSAGFTVGVMMVAQGIAYAPLATRPTIRHARVVRSQIISANNGELYVQIIVYFPTTHASFLSRVSSIFSTYFKNERNC
jgi:hypothetical protein